MMAKIMIPTRFQLATGKKKRIFSPIIIIGSDLWDIKHSDINLAFNYLTKNDYVIGPSTDGGYYLIGMNAINSKLFENLTVIDWGEIPNFDMVINATSLGLKGGDNFDFSFNNCKASMIYIDTIYNPLKTKMIEELNHQEIKTFNEVDFKFLNDLNFHEFYNKEMPDHIFYELPKYLVESLKNGFKNEWRDIALSLNEEAFFDIREENIDDKSTNVPENKRTDNIRFQKL